jgi:hypothetical protein
MTAGDMDMEFAVMAQMGGPGGVLCIGEWTTFAWYHSTGRGAVGMDISSFHMKFNVATIS